MNNQRINEYMEDGRFYHYVGEDMPGAYRKGKYYRCSLKLTYMIFMSRLGKRVGLTLADLFSYPCNDVKNWRATTIKNWKQVREIEAKD